MKTDFERAKEMVRRKQENKITIKDIPSIIIGPKRQENESQEDYKKRLKKEKTLMKARLKYGISQNKSGQIKNPNRKIKKAVRKIQKG